MTNFISSIHISKKWLITGVVVIALVVFGLVYGYNQFYRQDKISIEVLQGSVVKTSSNQKNTVPSRGDIILPNDSLEISKDGSMVLIFHDGSTLAFKAGENIKYDKFTVTDQKNHFSFVKLNSGEKFEYVTESYLNKAGAVILGKEDTSMENNMSRSQVLGASERKIEDVDKIKLWDKLNTCIQKDKNEMIYSKLVQKCMDENNLYTLESLYN
jgi:hypothetical protein